MVQTLDELYASMPVSSDGYYMNVSRTGCSIHVSPATLDYALQFLNCLFIQLERINATVELSLDRDEVPRLVITNRNKKMAVGIRESQNIRELKIQNTIFLTDEKGYRIVPKIDAAVTGTLRFSYHYRHDYRYVDLQKTKPVESQVNSIISRIDAYLARNGG